MALYTIEWLDGVQHSCKRGHADCLHCPEHETRDYNCAKCSDHLKIGSACGMRDGATILGSAKILTWEYESGDDYNARRRLVAEGPDREERGWVTDRTHRRSWQVPAVVVLREIHKGRVVALGVDYNVRVMSDDWDNVPYAIVHTEQGTFEKVSRYSGPGSSGKESGWYAFPHRDEIDADPWTIATYQLVQNEARIAREYAEREADRARRDALAKAEAKGPRKGRTVKVVRGRKVKVGTTGIVFWIGKGHYGERVGMHVGAAKEVVWVDAKNVEAI